MDYLLLCFFRRVRSTDRLAGGRSVLRHTIDRMRLWCVFLNTRGVSRITSPCLLVGLLLHPHESKGKSDAHVEGLDGLGRTFEGMLIVLGVGGCGLLFMDGARSVEAGVWVIGGRNLCSADVGNSIKQFCWIEWTCSLL